MVFFKHHVPLSRKLQTEPLYPVFKDISISLSLYHYNMYNNLVTYIRCNSTIHHYSWLAFSFYNIVTLLIFLTPTRKYTFIASLCDLNLLFAKNLEKLANDSQLTIFGTACIFNQTWRSFRYKKTYRKEKTLVFSGFQKVTRQNHISSNKGFISKEL